MSVWFSRTDTGFRGWFQAVRSTGGLRTAAASGSFTFIVVSPDDSGSMEFFVSESQQKSGLYFADIEGSYLLVSGTGDYGVSVEIDIPNPQKVTAAFSSILHVTQEDWDSLSGSVADAVWDEPLIDHGISGSTGIWFQRDTFDGRAIHIDTTNGTNGTAYPQGTEENPVDNLLHAREIADRYGFSRYHVHGNLTLTSAHNDWTFVGESVQGEIDVNGQTTNGTIFIGATVSGSITSNNVEVFGGKMKDVRGFRGIADGCGLDETIEIVGNATLKNCNSEVAGAQTPIITFNGGAVNLNLRRYSGGITIDGMDSSNKKATLEFAAGQAIVSSSCTAGELVIRGAGVKVTDNSAGTTVDVRAAIDRPAIAQVVWEDSGSNRPVSGTMGWYQTQIVDTLVSGSGVNVNSGSRVDIAEAVWDRYLPGEHEVSGTAGKSLQTAGTGGVDTGALATAVWSALSSANNTSGTMGELQNNIEVIRALMENDWELSGSQMVFYGNDGTSPFRIMNIFQTDGSPFFSETGAPAARELTGSLE